MEVEVSAITKGDCKLYEAYNVELVGGKYVADVRLTDLSNFSYDIAKVEDYDPKSSYIWGSKLNINPNQFRIEPLAYSSKYITDSSAILKIDGSPSFGLNQSFLTVTNGEMSFTTGILLNATINVDNEPITLEKCIIHNEDGTTEERDASYVVNYNEDIINRYAYIEMSVHHTEHDCFSKPIKIKLVNSNTIVSNVTLPENIVI